MTIAEAIMIGLLCFILLDVVAALAALIWSAGREYRPPRQAPNLTVIDGGKASDD